MKNLTSTFLFLFVIANTLNAATYTFTNGGGDNLWSNAANWNPAVVPGNGDDVIINNIAIDITQSINVNSLTINGSSTVSFDHSGISKIGDLIISGGSIDSKSKIQISNAFNWTGTSSITSSSDIELKSSCVSNISGSGNRNLYAAIINNGTGTHSGGSLRFHSGSSFENKGTYTFDGASFVINTGGGAFTNKGTVNKNNTNELNFFAAFEQSGNGVLNINEGTLKLLWGGDNTGSSSINIASDAVLNLNAGTYTFGNNTSIIGSGNVEYSGATFSIDGDFNLSGETKISGGTVSFNNGTASFDKLLLSGGTLQGSSKIIISDQLSWSGTSTISTTDTLKIENTAIGLIFTGGSKNLYTVLANEGTISHTAGNLRFYPGGSLENNGTYTLNGPTEIYNNGGGDFENNGSFEHQSAGTVTISPNLNNNLNGIITGKGKIGFSNLSNLGTFAADAVNGKLSINGAFDNGKALDIAFDDAVHGDLEVSGNITLGGDLDVTVVGSVPAGTYEVLSTTAGTISGTFDNTNLSAGFSIQYTSTAVNLLVGVLPVEFTKFDVTAQRDEALLTWQTASEINSKSFIIEHSPDGQRFADIGAIQAAGFSNEIKNYDFVHTTPLNGLNYYRLRELDNDGSIQYSDLRVLNHYNFDKDLTIYPNPTQGMVTIKNRSEKEFKLTITDLSGKIIYVRNGITPGATMLDLQDLPKAMYTLEISDDGFYSHKEKLMILE